MQRTITSAAYDARILKLRLPEQNQLKDETGDVARLIQPPGQHRSRCGPAGSNQRVGTMLSFVAVYTVKHRTQTVQAEPMSFAQA